MTRHHPDAPAAFLRAVIADPANDLPRLLYADFLDEHAGHRGCPVCADDESYCEACQHRGHVSNGYAARAELIRVQCELARMTPAVIECDCAFAEPMSPNCPTCDAAVALAARESALLDVADWWNWVEEPVRSFCCTNISDYIAPGVASFTFRRGFVEEVRMAWNRDAIEAMRQTTPLRKVVLMTWPDVEQRDCFSDAACCLRIVPDGEWHRLADLMQTEDDESLTFAELVLRAEFPGVELKLPETVPNVYREVQFADLPFTAAY